MAKVSQAELGDVKGNEQFNQLDELSNALRQASTAFGSFVTLSKKRLKGPGYDTIRLVTSLWEKTFDKLSTFDVNAYDNISQGLDQFIAYMESYKTLDDSRIDSLVNGLKYIGTRIGTLESSMKKADLSDEELAKLRNQLYGTNGYYNQYKDLDKEYNKLKNLAQTNSSTGACIDNINTDITSIRTALSDVPIGTPFISTPIF